MTEIIAQTHHAIKHVEVVDDLVLTKIAEIKSWFRGEIPEDTFRWLVNFAMLPREVHILFMGYEPLSLEEIVTHCKDTSNSNFFKYFDLDGQNRATQDSALRIGASVDGYCENEAKILDVQNLVPLFDGGSGFFICLFHNPQMNVEIATVTEDSMIYSFAPSISEHLENIEIGISNNIFRFEDSGLHMPTSWHQRVQAVTSQGLSEDSWDS